MKCKERKFQFCQKLSLKFLLRTVRNKHTSLKKKKNQEQTKHINVQITQLHQVWSHRRKEKGDPSIKNILKHLKLNSVHFAVVPHSLSLLSQWTPSESRSIHLRLTHPKSDKQM